MLRALFAKPRDKLHRSPDVGELDNEALSIPITAERPNNSKHLDAVIRYMCFRAILLPAGCTWRWFEWLDIC